MTAFCEDDRLQDGAQLSPQWSRLKTTAHRKQERKILTCQSAVENHLSLGKIDKVKKEIRFYLDTPQRMWYCNQA